MNAEQWQWLLDAANRIPVLFGAIEQGNIRADANLGERVINGKHVRLYFVAEVVDPGRDPLESHASVNFPVQQVGNDPDVQVKDRPRRSRPKRW